MSLFILVLFSYSCTWNTKTNSSPGISHARIFTGCFIAKVPSFKLQRPLSILNPSLYIYIFWTSGYLSAANSKKERVKGKHHLEIYLLSIVFHCLDNEYIDNKDLQFRFQTLMISEASSCPFYLFANSIFFFISQRLEKSIELRSSRLNVHKISHSMLIQEWNDNL